MEPTRKNIEKLVREYLSKAQLVQVATCADNQPWMANVWYSFDKDLNLYFISGNYRRHSKEIRKQKKVAGGIVQPKLIKKVGQKCQGITFEGTAEELRPAKSLKAFVNFMKRYPQATKYVSRKDMRDNATKVRFYKITPTMYVLFDEVNFPENSRQELLISPKK